MYKICVYQNSLIIGYVFVTGIGSADYPFIVREIQRVFPKHNGRIRRGSGSTPKNEFAFNLAN